MLTLETLGDPWHRYTNPHSDKLGLGSWTYCMIITISTVGYGDIYPQTDWGRVFVIFYVVGGISLFANYLPELAQILGNRPK